MDPPSFGSSTNVAGSESVMLPQWQLIGFVTARSTRSGNELGSSAIPPRISSGPSVE